MSSTMISAGGGGSWYAVDDPRYVRPELRASTNKFYSGNETQASGKLRAHKCLSCGAPLHGMTCDHCGGTHLFECDTHTAPSKPDADRQRMAAEMVKISAMYGMAIVNPE